MVQAFRRFVRSWPLLIALLISGCGDGEMDLSTSSGESDTGGNQAAAPDRDTFVQAKQAQIAGLKPTLNQTGEEVDILIVDFQAKLMYSESLGLQDLVASEQTPPRETSLPSQAVQSQAAREASPKILAQEADSAGEAFRRVPSVIGPFFQPLTVIDGSVKLPKASDLNWIDEGGDVAYNYLGLQYLHDPQSVITVDAGLISDSIAAHVRGKWYAFAAYTPVNGQYTAFSFRGWPVGGIAGETETRMRLEAVRDANPLLSGDQAGYFLRFFYGEGREALAVFEGIGVADLHGTGTAVRRVSTLLWASDDDDPRMCDVKWSNVRIGNEFGTRLFGPEDVNTTGPGEKLALVDGRVTDEIPYHEETVHLSCGKAVGMVIDTTGSMGGEIGAVKAALTAFIQSPAAEEVGTWTLSTFKDSASSFGLSSDSQVVKSWVSGLSASGGGDCPEESFGALRQAGEALEDVASPKSLILVTDASPRTGTVAAAKAHLLERDITLYVLLTGDCVSGVSAKSVGADVRAQSIISARAAFSELAAATGGKYVYMPGGSTAAFTEVLAGFFEDAATGPSDTEPPTLSISVSPDTLWPPNHKMVEIDVDYEVEDNQDPNPEVRVVGVASSEPDDIQGSGNTAPDYEIRPDGKIFVRSERSGSGNKRVYTITYEAEDNAGNKSFASADVTVPHSKGNK